MKVRSAESAAFIIAGITAILSAGGAVIDYLFADGPWKWYYLSYSAGVLVIVYFIALLIIRRLIIYRIKPIYQIVLARDVKTKELEKHFLYRSDFIEDIHTEVSERVQGRSAEIERLRQNETYRKEFIGNVSHELKTPVFNIQGYVSTLLDGGLEDPSINRTYLQRADKSIDRLINIITDLDAINKLEANAVNLNKESFDLIAMMRGLIDTIQYEAEKYGIRIILETPPQRMPIMVLADRGLIEKVMVNLLSNSLHYGRPGGTTRVSFIDLLEKILVEVADDGIGISGENIPHIFERFFRVDKSRSREQGGTGLGLAIVKHTINAHGETISVRSEQGRGTTFSFTLAKG